jgi:hypothetical protein
VLNISIPDSPPTLLNLYHVGDIKKWMENPHNLYIGRSCRSYNKASYWQNTFRISSFCSRTESLANFKSSLQQNVEMRSKISTLANKNLGCWCFPQPCHGDILINFFLDLPIYDESEMS